MIPVDLSANCDGWIYDPNGSGIQILGIRSRDPFSGSTCLFGSLLSIVLSYMLTFVGTTVTVQLDGGSRRSDSPGRAESGGPTVKVGRNPAVRQSWIHGRAESGGATVTVGRNPAVRQSRYS